MTKTEQEEAFIDIAVNPLSFLKYVRIQEPGKLAVSYELWPHLVDFYWALETHKLLIGIKAKQVGFSWALAIYALKQIYVKSGWNVLEISKGENEAKALLEKSRIVYNNLPDWLKIYTLEPNSKEQFGFKEKKSKIVALPSTETAGIGETAGLVIHDEADFHEFFEVNLSHTQATVADKPDRQLVVVSTTDVTKPDSDFKRLFKGGIGSGFPEQGSNSFQTLFRPYNVRPNRDEAWYKEQEKVNEATPWVMKANYPRTIEEALTPLSAFSCFDKDVVRKLWDEAEEPETEQGFIHILCPPRVGVQYVGGVDVGEGVGLDYSVLSIVGKDGLKSELAAVIYTNTLGTDSFAFEVDRLCRKYYNPLLVVDNIGIGRAVIDKLVELGYPNLFYQDNEKKKAGWNLTRPNKRELAVKLVESINNGSLITRFRPMIKEMMEYQWINGYPEPTGKTHGDLIIALMFCNMLLPKVGSGFKPAYFIKGRRVF